MAILTRAPLALGFSTTYWGGGGGVNAPVYLGSCWSQRKAKKRVRKVVKNNYQTISVTFSLRSKLLSPGPKNGKLSSFSRLSNIVIIVRNRNRNRNLVTSIISGTIKAMANPKTAFER